MIYIYIYIYNICIHTRGFLDPLRGEMLKVRQKETTHSSLCEFSPWTTPDVLLERHPLTAPPRPRKRLRRGGVRGFRGGLRGGVRGGVRGFRRRQAEVALEVGQILGPRAGSKFWLYEASSTRPVDVGRGAKFSKK